ncbi:MAG TPA: hypothetical protein VF997_02125 [Polyangia bacterium]
MSARTAARLVVAALAATVGAGGCSKADLGAAAFVDGLRLLGVHAEPPEASPGDTVTLTAWVVDPRGGAIDVAWHACMLPSNGLANPGCTDGSGNGLVGLGSGLTISMVVPEIDLATLGPSDASWGVYLPIVVHARAADDALDAVYRLRVREVVAPGCTLAPPYIPGCVPNRNPDFSTIDPLGPDLGPIATHEGAIWALLARYADGSDEEYKVPSSVNPTVPERLTTQWFATAGSFPDQPVGGTAVQKLTIDRALPPPGGTIDLWVVGHDERGGTALAHRTFVMQ